MLDEPDPDAAAGRAGVSDRAGLSDRAGWSARDGFVDRLADSDAFGAPRGPASPGAFGAGGSDSAPAGWRRGSRGTADRVRAALAAARASSMPPAEPAESDAAPADPASPPGSDNGPGVRRWRFDPGRLGALAVGGAAVLVAVVTILWVWSSRPSTTPVSSAAEAASASPGAATASVVVAGQAPPGQATPGQATPGQASAGRPPAGSTASAPTSSSSGVVVVDVDGKVRHPGVYRLPVGARVYQAVNAAGGPLPGVSLTSLNLAAPVSDGEQIVVGAAVPTVAPTVATGTSGGSPAGGSGSAGTGAGGLVDLNTADLTQLESLPGIGPALGQRILDWRTAHGRFTSIDQLQDVSGIGPAKYAALRDHVTV